MKDKYGVFYKEGSRLPFGSIGPYNKSPNELMGGDWNIIAEFPDSQQASDLQAKLNVIFNLLKKDDKE